MVIDRLDENSSRRRTTRSSTLRMTAMPNAVTLLNVVPAAGRVRGDTRKVDTVLKVDNAGTRGAMTTNNRAVHRAGSVARCVAMMSKVIHRMVRAVTRAEVEPATVKMVRAAERDTDKAGRGIAADTLKVRATISKVDTRRVHRKVAEAELAAIVVRRVVFRMTKQPSLFNHRTRTTTSVAAVAALSRTTRRSPPSIDVPRVVHVRRAARVRNDVALFRTMSPHRNQRAVIRLSVVRLADRAATVKQVIESCPLVAEASGRAHLRAQ